jgi:DNA-directed RNA polymerase alpha subunit
MSARQSFTEQEARVAADAIGVDLSATAFDLEQLRAGMDVELEHGARDPLTNVTNDELITTAKIALAHLNEFPDYYERLEEMEAAARAGEVTSA